MSSDWFEEMLSATKEQREAENRKFHELLTADINRHREEKEAVYDMFGKALLQDKEESDTMQAEIDEIYKAADKQAENTKTRYQYTYGLKPYNSTIEDSYKELLKATMENKG